MFNGLGNLGSLLSLAMNAESRFKKMKTKLEETDVSACAEIQDEHFAAEIVEIKMNGLGENIIVTISPGLLAVEQKERLEGLVKEALEKVVQKFRAAIYDEAVEFSRESGIPGLDKMLDNLK